MLQGLGSRRVFVYRQVVDMRKSFNGLICLVESDLKQDSLSGDVFVFSGKRGNVVKLLYFDRTGYCLFMKRLEKGCFQVGNDGEVEQVTHHQLDLLLDGLSVYCVKMRA